MSSCAASKSTRTRHFRHLHFISSRDACLVNHFGVNPVDRRFALAATGARRSGSSGTLLTSVRCLQPLGTAHRESSSTPSMRPEVGVQRGWHVNTGQTGLAVLKRLKPLHGGAPPV